MTAQHIQMLESTRSERAGDISAIRRAILAGSRLSPRDRDNLVSHLKQTLLLLNAAMRVCEKIIASLTEPV